MNTNNTGLDSLQIYKLAGNLEIFIYKMTKDFPIDEKYRSVDQLRRSSSSAADNIAEGYGGYFFQDKINKFYIARGEAEETRKGIKRSQKKGFISLKMSEATNRKYVQLIKQINTYVGFLRRRAGSLFQSPSTQTPKHPYSSAQSLIETIVAIGIIITAIVAILSVGMANLVLGGQSAERITAVNLAREGLEVVVAIRSSNWLDPDQNWPYGLANDIYILNYSTESLVNDGDESTEDAKGATFSGEETIENCTNCYLCLQDGEGDESDNDTYIHCDSEDIFRRMISVSSGDDLGDNCAANCEKKVVSTVYWKERGYPHTISLEARLTDWR